MKIHLIFTDPFHPGCKWVKSPGWRCNIPPRAEPRSHCLVLDWRSRPMIDQLRAANSSQWKSSVIRLQLQLHHKHFSKHKIIFSTWTSWYAELKCDVSSGRLKKKKMSLKHEGYLVSLMVRSCTSLAAAAGIIEDWLMFFSRTEVAAVCEPVIWRRKAGMRVTQLTLLTSSC